jgi:hypothetical protein
VASFAVRKIPGLVIRKRFFRVGLANFVEFAFSRVAIRAIFAPVATVIVLPVLALVFGWRFGTARGGEGEGLVAVCSTPGLGQVFDRFGGSEIQKFFLGVVPGVVVAQLDEIFAVFKLRQQTVEKACDLSGFVCLATDFAENASEGGDPVQPPDEVGVRVGHGGMVKVIVGFGPAALGALAEVLVDCNPSPTGVSKLDRV